MKRNRLINGLVGQRSRALRWRGPLATLALFLLIASGFALVRASAGERFAWQWPGSLARILGSKSAPALSPTPVVATLLSWNTFGNAGTETTEPSTANDANLSASNLTRGAGVSGALNGDRFGGNNWFDTGDTNPTTLTESIAGNDYIEFIVTPTAGFSFTPTSLVFSWDRSGTGPGNVALRSSTDSFAADLGSATLAASLTTGNTITISGLTNLTMATTFRLYGYGATSAAGTGGFDTATNAVNVQLNGTTAFADVTFSASGNLGAGTYHDITINSPANVTLTGDVIITGTLTINNGGTLTCGTNTVSGGGSFVLATDGTLSVGDLNGITTAACGTGASCGNIRTTSRTFNSGASFIYTGGDNQVVGDGLPASVLNLTIANTGSSGHKTVTNNANQVVTGTLEIVTGIYSSHSDYVDVLIDVGGTLSLAANITVSGNWTNNGTFTHNGFGVTFDGTGAQTITTGGMFAGKSFAQFAVNKSAGTATLAGDLGAQTLVVTAGTFDQGASFRVDTSGAGAVATIGASGTWQNFGTGDLVLSGNVSNAGTINFNGNGTGCNEIATNDILIRSSASPTQRTWTGTGTFSMTDVDVADQVTAAPPVFILVNSGTNSGNNTPGWTFVNQCTAGTYTWVGGTAGVNTDWQVATNWNPARLTPAVGDVLIFDGTSTPAPTVTNVPTETISSLRLQNGVNPLTLNAAAIGAPHTLTITGNAGLDIPATNLLTVAGTNGLTVSVATGSASTIGGQIILQGGAHALTGANSGQIVFANGSLFTTSTGFTGHPFGTGTDDSVRFHDGSSAFFNAGSDPFGGSGNAIVTFTSASNQQFNTSTAWAAEGRSYGNLTLAGASQTYFDSTAAIQVTVLGNLTIGSDATFKLSDVPGGDLNLLGNFSDNNSSPTAFQGNGRVVKFQGGSATQTISKAGGIDQMFSHLEIAKTGGSVQLLSSIAINGQLQFGGIAGSAVDVLELNAQSVSLAGTVGAVPDANSGFKGDVVGASLFIGVNASSLGNPIHFISGGESLTQLSVDRVSGATIDTDLTIGHPTTTPNGILTLTNGIVDMGPQTLTLNPNASISRTSGYVSGNLKKNFGATGTFNFAVGTANGYSPVGVDVTGTGDLTVKAVQAQQPNITGTNALQRYWTLNGTGITAKLTFNYLDPTDIPGSANENAFVIFKYDGSFSTPGGSVDTGANTATTDGVTQFSDWTLAEACPTITLSPVSLPDGAIGHAYPTSIGASGGVEPYMFAVTSGSVPNGLILNSNGSWSGMPDTPGTSSFTVTATDANFCTGSSPYTIKIKNCSITPFTVNSIGDTEDLDPDDGLCKDASGDCTLRAAIQQANKTPIACGPVDIGFSVTGTIVLSNPLDGIQHDVNINNTAGASAVTVDGQEENSIFVVDPGFTVGIAGLTITRGQSQDGSPEGGGLLNEGGTVTVNDCIFTNNTAGAGGAIYTDLGSLTLNNCVLDGNTANGDGGGLYNFGSTVALNNSRVDSNNSEAGFGGGIFNCGDGTMTIEATTVSGNSSERGAGIFNEAGLTSAQITNSTISSNDANDGGGIYNGGTLKVINSTISGNTALTNGGGIYNDVAGLFTFANVTVTNNHCDDDDDDDGDGGGLYVAGGAGADHRLRNTIVSGNFRHSVFFNPPVHNNIAGGNVTGSFNLIGTGSGGLNSSAPNILDNNDPKLAPLGDYGGPTQTHALLTGSPAIDKGDNCVTDSSCEAPYNTIQLDFDQRGSGFPRKIDGDGDTTATVDIGAFESPAGGGTTGPDFVVNTKDDHDDGVCESLSTGDCTLREAIIAANVSADANTIKFDIPGAGVQTISVTTNLPASIYPVTIDGFTQNPCSVSNPTDCSKPNDDPNHDAAQILIELEGSLDFDCRGIGLTILGGSSTIRGFVINRFFGCNRDGTGILLSGNGGNTIAGNFIGTDVTGLLALDDSFEPIGNDVGIQIADCANNLIGGPVTDSASAAARNLISANWEDGIEITGVNSARNIIRGNFVGTDATGEEIFDTYGDYMGNSVGISIYDGANNVIGNSELATALSPPIPAVDGAGNVISGNIDIGVETSSGLVAGPNGNGIGSNFIGTDLTGMLPLSNFGDGVQLCLDSHHNLVGGSATTFANIIANNYGNGVNLLDTALSGNTIRLNSIFDNSFLGIDINDDGVTINDAGDADPGPNDSQNFPVISTAVVTSGTLTINGSLNSTPDKTFKLDFYANQDCNDSGYGEGQTYLGSLTNVTTDAGTGDATWVFTGVFPPGAGSIITATATNDGGSTSEFSQCFTADVPPAPDVSVALTSASSVPEDGASNLVYQFTRTITTGSLSVNFSVSGSATFSTDYMQSGAATFTASSGTVTFPDGEPTVKVTVDPTPDTSPEGDEKVILKVTSGSGYNVGSPNTATGTIQDDDCPTFLLVNSNADTPDSDEGDGHCDTDGNLGNGDQCTLRAAIQEVNALSLCASFMTINFDITGAGVHTITPATPLPSIKRPVVIDGYSQPGAMANTSLASDNAVILIELDGHLLSAGANGLVLEKGNGGAVAGLVINRFPGAGILVKSSGNEISGNFIGTNATGTSAGTARAFGNGVGVLIYGLGNEVGCEFADMRNVISGNHQQGVSIMSGFGNFVQGNFIGTDITGTLLVDTNGEPLGNGAAGVEICGDATFTLVGVFPGGVEEEEGSFAAKPGALANSVSAERPAAAARGFAKRGSLARHSRTHRHNSAAKDSAKNSAITLSEFGAISGANIIAGNGQQGVLVTSDDNLFNPISQNSIYANGGLGINLVRNVPPPAELPNTVTANDDGDGDPGPNNLQNFPEITAANVTTQTIEGKLRTQVNNSDGYAIEFFASPSGTCDSSGHGEGKIFIGTLITGATDASGDVSFTLSSPVAPFGPGDVITATATDFDGNTSEFSQCFLIPAPDVSVAVFSPTPATVLEDGATNLVYRFTRTETTAAVTVNFSAGGSANSGDYSVLSDPNVTFNGSTGTVTFGVGIDTVDVTVDPTTDINQEPDDTVTLTVTSGAGYNLGNPSSATGTILNDDCPTMFEVKNNGDTPDFSPGDGFCGDVDQHCTLRAAIDEANMLPNCGTITITFNIGSATINVGSQLTIKHNVNIVGPDANSVTINGNGLTRLFGVDLSRTASISKLTLTGGNGSGGDGGAILTNGTLTLNAVTLNGNRANNGGAIRSDGTLILTNTTISGNRANGDGGGLYQNANQATLTNVTIADNRSDYDGNASGAGGGVFRAGGNVLLHNTIVADNYNGGSLSTTADNIGGTVDSTSSYNLVGIGSGGLNNGFNNNQVGVATALLGALMNNGGPTFTHGLLYNSPALEAGDDSVADNSDQRGLGFTRPANGDLTPGAHVDIGAYERQATETRRAGFGSDVGVDINDVRLKFPCVPAGTCGGSGAKGDSGIRRDVEAEGNTVSLKDVPVPVDAPAGSGPAFDVTPSSAFYEAPVTVCFYLPSVTNSATFSSLKVLHREGVLLVDHGSTTDFPAKTVCTQVTSFSEFVIAQPVVNPTAANGSVVGQIVDTNGNPVEGAAVRMNGTENRLTVTDAEGKYHFDDVETNGLYVVTPSRPNFTFNPAQRSFSQLGAHTDATFTASPAAGSLNPLDATEYFVRQQYLDFLGREPDEAGFNFWVNNIESCGNDIGCREVKRVDTSAAFFLSIESQQTGYLIYRFYQAAFGEIPNAPVPLRLSEYASDAAQISKGVVVLQTGWQRALENNTRAFAEDFVKRDRFVAAYPVTMTPAEFVDKLFANGHIPLIDGDHAAAIGEFGGAPDTSDASARARALRRIAENSVLARRHFNRAFVLMQYFGYLRRDPNSGQDRDFSGFNFWLDKLDRFDGNFRDAEMVKAFLTSIEYRARIPR